ncbi:hypothetical protein CR513_22341, partial [Mucuna pruriens]
MPPKMTKRVEALEAKMAKLLDRCSIDERHNGTRDALFSNGDSLTECWMETMKVELPLFGGIDPVFEVHGTLEEVKVKLAKLSMEGSTIYYFNLLNETEDHLA